MSNNQSNNQTIASNNTILSLVQQKATFNQIAHHLQVSKGTLSIRLKHMEAKGLIERKRIGRIMVLTIPVPILNNLQTITPSYRIHDLWLTFKLKDEVGNDTTSLLLSKGLKRRELKLNHHTDSYFVMDGYEARLNPGSLELHLEDLDHLSLDADLRQATLDLLAKAETALLKLEARLGIKVIRIDKDTIIAKISQLHIALRDHKFAETVNDRGEKLYVYVDGELRVIVDHSHGLHEYEAIHRSFAIDDAQRLGKLTKGTITGAFDYEKDHELLHQVIAIQTEIVNSIGKQTEVNTKQIGQLAEQLNIHAPYLTAWQKVAEAISSPTGRRKALKAIEDLDSRQKRLTR